MKTIAITIGPIYKTLMQAQKTREIWGASYFFSFIMKQIAQKLIQEGIDENSFLTPYVDGNKLQNKNGAGLFHDRMIIQHESISKEMVKGIVDSIYQEIEKQSGGRISKDFLQNYIQLHILEFDQNFVNPILDTALYLDSAELFFEAQRFSKNHLLDYIKNYLRGSFLAKDAFGSDGASFPSLPEIALAEFKDKAHLRELIDKDEETEVFEDEKIKEFLQEHPYAKYIAIVQADADKMGKVLKDIGTDRQKLRNLSGALFDFCLEATKRVEHFGGRMIYAGGDDLFFFAPMAYEKKHIVHLCKEIDELFAEKLQSISTAPTLSFGISVTYYKFPLYEARMMAASQLFDVAKKDPKNNIALRLIKHSGQYFDLVLHKGGDVYEKILEFLKISDEENSNFLHSFYTKVDRYKPIIEAIAKQNRGFDAFFENYFNEDEHRKYRPLFQKASEILQTAYNKEQDGAKLLYGALRLKKFLLGEKQ